MSATTRLAVGALLALASLSAAALDVLVEGDRVVLGGPISLSDSVKYREATRGARFGTVVLVNSPGGSIDVAMEIAEDVAARGADTVVAGFCNSACTYIFVAGRSRTMSDAWPAGRTRLGIHGTYDMVFGMASRDRGRVFAHYRRFIGDRFDAALFDRAINVDSRAELMYFYHPSYYRGAATQMCDGSPNPGSVACKPVPGKNALNVGLLTSLHLTSLKLPPRYEFQDLVLGFPMAGIPAVPDDELASACRGEPACLASLRDYAARGDERAWVRSASGRTHTAWGLGEKWLAARRALYECTARAGGPCRIAAIGARPMARLYEIHESETQSAMARLRALDPASLERAPADAGGYTVSRIQAQPPAGQTPGKVAAARELDTRDVAEALVEAARQAPLLLDAWCGERTLPGALCVVGAGSAYDDAVADRELEIVLDKALAAVAPDRGARLIVFGAGPRDWRSVNAVLRIGKLGYSRVEWYRGGVTAWRDAGLPHVQTAPVASAVK